MVQEEGEEAIQFVTERSFLSMITTYYFNAGINPSWIEIPLREPLVEDSWPLESYFLSQTGWPKAPTAEHEAK